MLHFITRIVICSFGFYEEFCRPTCFIIWAALSFCVGANLYHAAIIGDTCPTNVPASLRPCRQWLDPCRISAVTTQSDRNFNVAFFLRRRCKESLVLRLKLPMGNLATLFIGLQVFASGDPLKAMWGRMQQACTNANSIHIFFTFSLRSW
jgi:hypothetical protein